MLLNVRIIAYTYFCILLSETECPDLKDLCTYVLPLYAAQWKKIGIFLGMQSGRLDVIKANNPNNADGCCIDLFTEWLQCEKYPTWGKMFKVIDLLFDKTSVITGTGTSTSKW